MASSLSKSMAASTLIASLALAGTAIAGSASPSSPLVVSTTAVDLPNPTLLADAGIPYGFGDAEKGNGKPDGWRSGIKTGALAFKDGPKVGERSTTVIAVEPGTDGSLQSKAFPASTGQTWVLKTALDFGEKRKGAGSLGIAFMRGNDMIDYQLHRFENEFPGLQDVEIRASAPDGSDNVKIRVVFSGKDTAEASQFSIAPFSLEQVEATSRSRSFPLQHVFLITIETFRPDHSSLYGYSRETTPNLAKIAAEGAVLQRHYVQAPYTRPSLSSLVTSRYPASLGIVENIPPLPASANTMAEMFANSGYVTGGFVAQYLLSAHFGFNQGFHYFYNHPNDTTTDVVYGDMMPWLAAHKADNTFLWTHLFDPHGPYRPTDDYAKRFEGDALWNADTQQLTAGQGKLTGPFIPGYVADGAELSRRHYVARYDAEIAFVDNRIGQLVDWIKAEGMANSSMVIVTADHGESMTDHDRYFCHGSLYDNDVRVPAVVWAPGRVKPATVVTERTTHLDLVPTMLDYAGAGSQKGLKGKSIRGILDGKSKSAQPFSVAVVGQGTEEKLAVYDASTLKIIVNNKGEALEAYDLATDPAETNNLIGTRKADADKMAAAYRTWMAEQLKDDLPTPTKPAIRKPIKDDELEKLRELGYIE